MEGVWKGKGEGRSSDAHLRNLQDVNFRIYDAMEFLKNIHETLILIRESFFSRYSYLYISLGTRCFMLYIETIHVGAAIIGKNILATRADFELERRAAVTSYTLVRSLPKSLLLMKSASTKNLVLVLTCFTRYTDRHKMNALPPAALMKSVSPS